MLDRSRTIQVFICIFILLLISGIAGMAQAQFYNPFLGLNPFFFPYYPAQLSIGFYPPVLPSYPLIGAPAFAPPLPVSRLGAATIIVTNPTAGTVSVINPTVASVPAVPTAAAPAPLFSLLGTVYASALYEGALSTENPLLFALLQNLFL